MTIVHPLVRKLQTGVKFSVFVLLATAFALTAKAFDTAPYFPLSTDATWRYVITASDRHTPNTIFIRKEVGLTVINGTQVHIVQRSLDNREQYYTNDSNGVRDHGEFDPTFDAGSAGLVPATATFVPPQILLLPNATLGVPVTSSGTINFTISGTGTFPFSYSLTSTPEAFETVKSTVNSHTYRNVLRVRGIITYSGTITINGRSASLNVTDDETDWLVPTLGLVKSSSISTRPGAAPRHEEIELLGGSLQDDMPVVQTIPPVIGAIPNSTVTSAPFTVSGINIEANIVVSAGDKYSIDGGPFTDVSGGTVGDGQSVRLQTTAPPGLGQGIDRIVFIGSGRAALTVTTQLPPTGPYTGLFFYIVQPGNPISRQYSFQLPNVNDTGQILPFGGIGIPIVAGDVVAVAKNYGDGCCSAAFYTPVGKKLTAGTVENAEFGFVSLGSPFTLGVNGGAAVGYRHNFTECRHFSGRFVIFERELETNTALKAFAANFQQRCDDTGEIIVGQVRYNSMIPFDLGWSSFTPTPFTFDPPTGITFNGPVRSNPITVAGIVNPVTISVTGGAYSINGGAYTSTAGTVQSGDVVIAQVVTAGSPVTQSCASLDIGGVTRQFCATTPTASTGNAKKIILELIDD